MKRCLGRTGQATFFGRYALLCNVFWGKTPPWWGCFSQVCHWVERRSGGPAGACLPMGVGCSVQKLTAAPGAEHAQAIPRHYTDTGSEGRDVIAVE